MNNLFSWKRFAKLFKKHTAEHYKDYLMSVLVVSGILYLFLCVIQFYTQLPFSSGQQTFFYVIFLLFLGPIFTSRIFVQFSEKRKTVTALTLPASQLEKFLVAWVYSFLILQVVYGMGFYFTMNLVYITGNYSSQAIGLPGYLDATRQPFWFFLMYAFLHACTLLGAIAFKKWHFIKTAAVLLCFCLLLFSVNTLLLKYSLRGDLTAVPFMDLSYTDNSRSYKINVVDVLKPYLMALPVLLIILLWTSAYFHLKEKQV